MNLQSRIECFLVFLLPVLMNVLFDFIGYVKYRSMKKVFVSKILRTVCYIGAFISLFAFLSNLIDYVIGNDWFLIMMFICYTVLNIVLVLMRNEKIVYNGSNGTIICFVNFKCYKLHVSEITRLYDSDEFLDIYLGGKRIRYRNDFLCKIKEFTLFVRENSRAYYG